MRVDCALIVLDAEGKTLMVVSPVSGYVPSAESSELVWSGFGNRLYFSGSLFSHWDHSCSSRYMHRVPTIPRSLTEGM